MIDNRLARAVVLSSDRTWDAFSRPDEKTQSAALDSFRTYLLEHYDALEALGIWSDDTVWTLTMPDEAFTLTISGLPDGQRLQRTIDPETYAAGVCD